MEKHQESRQSLVFKIENRTRIVTLRELGWKWNAIVSHMNKKYNFSITTRSCMSLMKKYKESGTVDDQARSGRPKTLTQREERLLIRSMRIDPRKNAREAVSELQERCGKSVCKRTVLNILRKVKLLENLRNLPHAPGVQMQDVPPDGVSLEREQEAADEDSDKHPDKRISIYASDKRVTRDNELSDSDDEGEGGRRDAGAPPTATRKKRKVEQTAADSNQSQNGSQQTSAPADSAADASGEQKADAPTTDS